MDSSTGKLRPVKKVAKIIKRLLNLNGSASWRKEGEMVAATAAKRNHDSSLDAPLEKLPTELRLCLLLALKLDELRGLVHTSPVFYRDYHRRRSFVLCNSLRVTLGSVFVDACAAYRSNSCKFARSRTDERLAKFIMSYHNRRISSTYSMECEKLNEDQVSEMASFYLSIVRPLMQHYSNWALNNLERELEDDHPQSLFVKFSESEQVRLLRSLYRFHLCCNLYGSRFYEPLQKFTVNQDTILRDFLCEFEPWEIEEISCFYTFVAEKIDLIFSEVHWDLCEDNPKFKNDHRPPCASGAYELDEFRDMFMRNVISQGVGFLHSVLFTNHNHTDLVAVIEDAMTRYGDFYIDDALSSRTQYSMRSHHRSDRNDKEDRRDPLPFTGDSERQGNLGPPLGWTIIWDGTYSNTFGESTCKAIQRWGYVFWDAERLEHTGAKEVLIRQWYERHGSYDPRDEMFSPW